MTAHCSAASSMRARMVSWRESARDRAHTLFDFVGLLSNSREISFGARRGFIEGPRIVVQFQYPVQLGNTFFNVRLDDFILACQLSNFSFDLPGFGLGFSQLALTGIQPAGTFQDLLFLRRGAL